MSWQHASASQTHCSDSGACCHTKREVASQTCCHSVLILGQTVLAQPYSTKVWQGSDWITTGRNPSGERGFDLRSVALVVNTVPLGHGTVNARKTMLWYSECWVDWFLPRQIVPRYSICWVDWFLPRQSMPWYSEC